MPLRTKLSQPKFDFNWDGLIRLKYLFACTKNNPS